MLFERSRALSSRPEQWEVYLIFFVLIFVYCIFADNLLNFLVRETLD